MTSIRRINKKAIYGASMLFSAVLGFFFATSEKYETDILSVITEVPLASIERAYADDGGAGDCSGSSNTDGGGWTYASSGIGVGLYNN